MKWEKPALVDLADRKNAISSVGFSSHNQDVNGDSCVPGCCEGPGPKNLNICLTGGSAGIKF